MEQQQFMYSDNKSLRWKNTTTKINNKNKNKKEDNLKVVSITRCL